MQTHFYARTNADGSVAEFAKFRGPASLGPDWVEVQSAPPPRPSEHSTLVLAGGALEWADLRTLDQARATKRAQINVWRQQANESSFTFAGKQISCDRLSRGDIDGVTSEVAVTQALPATFPGGWKAMDNTYVLIPDVATWVLFVKAMVAQGSANFAHAQALKAQVEAAVTIAEVEAVVWPV